MKIHYLNDACERLGKTCDLEFGKIVMPQSGDSNLLIKNEVLNSLGYGIFRLTEMSTFDKIESAVTSHVRNKLSEHQQVPAGFTLSQYHRFLESEDIHYKISTWALEYTTIGDAFNLVKTQVEEILQQKLKVKRISHLGVEGEYLGFRIIRPGKNDHNPFHRDSWISYWQDTVNIWLPICGFENSNTLQIIPESHLWPDDQILKTKAGMEIDGKKYHVSAAIAAARDFTILSPDLSKGQAILFSPYLLHGNGINRMSDTTRVSMEFRFCRA